MNATLKLTELKTNGYQRVVRGIDEQSGLHALIAVHDTTLGPALGGLRMWSYKSEEDALFDVLRLSKGMTYKSAVAQTGLGGGKAVIIGDSRKEKRPELFQAMGELINALEGMYITAEDVGISVGDLDQVASTTKWVSGRSREDGGSGNPSPYTAHGCFVGIKACLEETWGSPSMKGKTFAIQGPGAVGFPLAQSIVEAGGKVIVADVNPDNVERAVRELGARAVDPDKIFEVSCEVFVPCALGAILNDETIPRLRAKIIAGCANNQLRDPSRHAQVLKDMGILYAPDYVINAGGIINVSCEFAPGGYHEALAMPKIDNIYNALKEVFATARTRNITTAQAADEVAERRLAEGRKVRIAS